MKRQHLFATLHRKHPPDQRGWYSRGYLPHLDFRKAIQGVTFRLTDALPKSVITRLKRTADERDDSLLKRLAEQEDRGYGECILQKPEHAHMIQEALLHFDGDRYALLEWVVMPNHVHVLFKPHSAPVDKIVQSWKRFISRRINESLGRSGRLWERDYFDRYIRDEDHFQHAVTYIRNNPVKAGLCARPEDWGFSSAAWSGRDQK